LKADKKANYQSEPKAKPKPEPKAAVTSTLKNFYHHHDDNFNN
jgi:hypothetical protein